MLQRRPSRPRAERAVAALSRDALPAEVWGGGGRAASGAVFLSATAVVDGKSRPAGTVAEISGEETQRWRFAQSDGDEPASSAVSPAGQLAAWQPCPAGTPSPLRARPVAASPQRRLWAAPLRLFPHPPGPTLLRSRGGGILWRRLRETRRDGTGPGCPAGPPPASGYPSSVTVCRYVLCGQVTHPSGKTLTVLD